MTDLNDLLHSFTLIDYHNEQGIITEKKTCLSQLTVKQHGVQPP